MFVATGIVALLAVLIAWRWQVGNISPEAPAAPPPPPNPNAYDVFVAAGEAVVDPKAVNAALTPFSAPRPGARVFSPAEQQALVRANAGVLKAVRGGFAQPFQAPPADDPGDRANAERKIEAVGRFRTLARLLVLEGQVKAGRGDADAAANCYLDAVRLGHTLPRGGAIIERLSGIACQATGRAYLWPAVDSLSAPGARAAARRLEAIRARSVPFADTLVQEKRVTLTSLLDTFDGGRAAAPGGGAPGAGAAAGAVFLVYPKRVIFENMSAAMDREIAQARRPFGAKAAEAAADPARDPLSRTIMGIHRPVFAKARFTQVVSETQDALLAAALALRAYRAGRGAYPAALNELAPAYLGRIPGDPFAPGKGLGYARQAGGYVLYSVGPDGKDDGGTPVDNPAARGSKRHRIEEGSRGDIVAGVNTG